MSLCCIFIHPSLSSYCYVRVRPTNGIQYHPLMSSIILYMVTLSIVGSSVTVATQIVSRATWTLISLNSLIGCFGIVAVIATSLVTLSFTIWLDCLFSALFLLGLVFWFPSFLRVACYAFVCDPDWAQA